MRNYVQAGDSLTLTAPSGGVVSGKGYLIGGLFLVAAVTAAEGVNFTGKRTGVFEFPAQTHASTQALAVGDVAYWDDTNKRVTKTATGNTVIGVVVEAKASTAATAKVVLVPRMAAAGALIAAPTGGGTVDAEARTAIGSILAALRSAGIIVT